MTITPYWMGFVSGVIATGAVALFVMAAINYRRYRRSIEAAQYVTRGARS